MHYIVHGNTLSQLAADGQSSVALDPVQKQSPFLFPCAKTAKLLLEMGFDVNAVNSNGDTPLHRAVTFKPSK